MKIKIFTGVIIRGESSVEENINNFISDSRIRVINIHYITGDNSLLIAVVEYEEEIIS